MSEELRQSSNPRIKRCRVRMCGCSVRVYRRLGKL